MTLNTPLTVYARAVTRQDMRWHRAMQIHSDLREVDPDNAVIDAAHAAERIEHHLLGMALVFFEAEAEVNGLAVAAGEDAAVVLAYQVVRGEAGRS